MGLIFALIFVCIATILIGTIPKAVMSVILIVVALFSGAMSGFLAGAPLARSLFQDNENARGWTELAFAILGAIVGVLLFKANHLF